MELDSAIVGVIVGSLLSLVGNFLNHWLSMQKEEKQWLRRQKAEDERLAREEKKSERFYGL